MQPFQPPQSAAPRLARGFFDRSLMHINVRELQAVALAIGAFFPATFPSTSARLRLLVDSQVVMYCIHNMTTASPQLLRHLRQLQRICFGEIFTNRPRIHSARPEYGAGPTFPGTGSGGLHVAPINFQGDYSSVRLSDNRPFCFSREFPLQAVQFTPPGRGDLGGGCFPAGLAGGTQTGPTPPWSLLPRLTAFLAARLTVEAVVFGPRLAISNVVSTAPSDGIGRIPDSMPAGHVSPGGSLSTGQSPSPPLESPRVSPPPEDSTLEPGEVTPSPRHVPVPDDPAASGDHARRSPPLWV